MTLEELQNEQKNLETQLKQAEMQAATINGALMFCKHLITQMEYKNAAKAQQDQGSSEREHQDGN